MSAELSARGAILLMKARLAGPAGYDAELQRQVQQWIEEAKAYEESVAALQATLEKSP